MKPENILLDSHGDVKLCDFGISNSISEALMTGLLGTPSYMAPEMMEVRAQINYAVDVYAFGIILWEMYMLENP